MWNFVLTFLFQMKVQSFVFFVGLITVIRQGRESSLVTYTPIRLNFCNSKWSNDENEKRIWKKSYSFHSLSYKQETMHFMLWWFLFHKQSTPELYSQKRSVFTAYYVLCIFSMKHFVKVIVNDISLKICTFYNIST